MGIGRKQHEANKKKYIKLCKQGKTYKEIEQIMGVSHSTVMRYKKETGIEKTIIHWRNEKVMEAIEEMENKGVSLQNILDTLGISRFELIQYRYMLGLSRKNKKKIKSFNTLEYLENLYNNLDYLEKVSTLLN